VDGPHVSRPVWKHIWKGGYEAPEIEALTALLKDGDRVLELGCGMGIVSAVVAKKLPGIRVWSYEANPALLPVIDRLHQMNGITNVSVRNAVLLPTSEGGTRTLHINWNFAESSLNPRKGSGQTVDVPVEDINAVLGHFRPDVLLCDIEGAEQEVFDGVKLDGIRAMVIELHPALISRAAVRQIFDSCAAASLYPRVDLCRGTVVAFERVED